MTGHVVRRLELERLRLEGVLGHLLRLNLRRELLELLLRTLTFRDEFLVVRRVVIPPELALSSLGEFFSSLQRDTRLGVVHTLLLRELRGCDGALSLDGSVPGLGREVGARSRPGLGEVNFHGLDELVGVHRGVAEFRRSSLDVLLHLLQIVLGNLVASAAVLREPAVGPAGRWRHAVHAVLPAELAVFAVRAGRGGAAGVEQRAFPSGGLNQGTEVQRAAAICERAEHATKLAPLERRRQVPAPLALEHRARLLLEPLVVAHAKQFALVVEFGPIGVE